jgi:predicted RNA-binding Zn ribbon-like protein
LVTRTDTTQGSQGGRHSVAAAGVEEEGAPGRLELVRTFVNTRDVEDGIEDLATPVAARRWLRRHDLPDRAPADERELRRLTELREALRELLHANNGGPVSRRALDHLRAEAARVPLVVRFDGVEDSALVPAGAGLDAVVGELVGIVHEAIADGTWTRLKACRSETCEWAFYDRSRNRSGTWCSMAVCGNREKARSYRHRHGAAKKN